MYPSTSPKHHPTASAPTAHPDVSKRPLPYTPVPPPAFPHLHAPQVHRRTSHLHDPQWTTHFYQSQTQHSNPQSRHQPPTLQLTALKDPIYQTCMEHYAPPPLHPCHHASDLVTPQSQPPPPQHSYMCLHHQVVAPVAHVPIGAAHYAHLPPSVWNPPHAQYHHVPHVAHHPRPIHTVAQSTSHLHVHALPHNPSPHLQHVSRLHAPHQLYPLAAAQPHLSQRQIHSHSVYQPRHIACHAPPIPQTTVSQPPKPTVAVPYNALPSLAYTIDTPQHATERASGETDKSKETADGRNVTSADRSLKTGDASEDRHSPSSVEQHLVQSPVKRTPPSKPAGVASLCGTREVYTVIKEGDGNQACRSKDHNKFVPPRQRGQQHSGQTVRKPRKPYTISKTREVWTQEEHARFVHALQMYDRDWKKIESYIGTKTVLQIRSHAQKHFGKVTKYQTGEYIPPPRPKKRAVLPYPRSRSLTTSKGNGGSGEAGSDSGGSDNATSGGASRSGSIGTVGNSSATLSGLRVSSQSDEPDSNGSSAHSLRFGAKPSLQEARPLFLSSDSNDDTGAMDGLSRPYCDPASRTSCQGLPLLKAKTLPPPTMLDVPLGARQPSWKDTKSMSVNNFREHSQKEPRSAGDIQNEVHAEPERTGSKESFDLSVDLKDSCKNVHSSINDRKVSEQSQDDRGAVRATKHAHGGNHLPESGSHGAVRVADGGRVSGPNNSLLVLSDCVDMASGETALDSPAVGRTGAYAARHAHGVQSMRGQKLLSPLLPFVTESVGATAQNSTEKEATTMAGLVHGPSNMPKRNGQCEELILPSDRASRLLSERGRSPPAFTEGGVNKRGLHDPQRNSAGSGSNSDDGIAGLSNSDRPSGLSSVGSGCGESPGSIGDGEEDPKSSNGGSGDDSTGQQSPPLRDPSCADPSSSLSRENSPLDDGAGNHKGMEVEAVDADKSPLNHKRRRIMNMGALCDDGIVQPERHKACELQKNSECRERFEVQSIANLCSDGISVEEKMRIKNLDNRVGGRKRPRCANSGELHSGNKCFKGGKEDAGDGEKRERHSSNGVVNILG